jgi:hypothetical protein
MSEGRDTAVNRLFLVPGELPSVRFSGAGSGLLIKGQRTALWRGVRDPCFIGIVNLPPCLISSYQGDVIEHKVPKKIVQSFS